MITPIFIPINTTHSSCSSMGVEHPFLLIITVIIPLLLSVISLGTGIISLTLCNEDFENLFMNIAAFFIGITILGTVLWAIAEAISSIL